MHPESWLVLIVAAAFLLLGIAGSPLAWVLIYHRRSRVEQLMELRWRKLADQVRALDDRLSQREVSKPADSGMGSLIRPNSLAGLTSFRADSSNEPALITVPNLEDAPNDRDANLGGLKDRYAAIWALADTGATPEVIARATGQPRGQIELILGLRRQIGGTRTIFTHEPHA